MRAIQIDHYVVPDQLSLREVATPTPREHEVLIRVRATSINDWDWGNLKGAPINRLLEGLRKPRRPLIPGCDVAGEVEAVGAGVQRFKPGDAVFGDLCTSGFGAFAEYVCAPESALALKPPSMSFAQAAAFPQAGILALQGLYDVGGISARRSLLVNGAGGGVGTFAIQMAKNIGVEVTAVDSAGKLEMLRALGADHTIDYRQQNFTSSGARYDLILDARSTRSPFEIARALNPGGRYATVGGTVPRLLQIAAFGRLLGGGRQCRVVAQKPNKDLPQLIEWFEAGKLVPIIDGPYPFDGITEALRHFGTAGHLGKIIVEMP